MAKKSPPNKRKTSVKPVESAAESAPALATSPPAASPRPLRAAPKKLSKEEEELWRDYDLIGLEYLRMESWRFSTTLTEKQRVELAQHDALESRIQSEPRKVLDEAREAINLGTMLMLKLIRSRRLHDQLHNADGSVAIERESAASGLSLDLKFLIQQFILFAERGYPCMRKSIFHYAKTLSESFIRLAQAHPEEFISAAEGSLTMPSVRSRNPGFTADADAIAKGIHLGERHPVPDITDNRTRAGAHCHLLMAGLMERVRRARSHYEQEKKDFEMLQRFDEKGEYRDFTFDKYLRNGLSPEFLYRGVYEEVTACADLPAWDTNPFAWWKGRLLALVREEFRLLSRNPARNPGLWQELGRGGESIRSTLNDRRRYLEKVCHNKFIQIASSARRTAAHGQRG
jgi:hypothetical protein